MIENEGPVPDAVLFSPASTRAYAFLARRIGGRAPTVSTLLVPLFAPLLGRSLEIAIVAASDPETPPDLTPWQIASDRADAARRAIDHALEGLTGLDFMPWRALRRTRYGSERDTGSLDRNQAKAEADLIAIRNARELLESLASDAKRRRDEWAAERKNTGDLSRQAFVQTLAEAWLFLTGALPGRSNDPTKNPFLAFVGEAWADWHGAAADVPSFFSQTKTALEALEGTASWLPPSWMELHQWQHLDDLLGNLALERMAEGNTTPRE